MPAIVLVNGIDDSANSKDIRKADQLRIFKDQFPGAKIEVFETFDDEDGEVSEGYLRNKAKDVIAQLHTLDLPDDERIVFIAHNTGAALVKQVLLLSLEDRGFNWIAFQTVALYFIESPSYTNHLLWEGFLFRLLSAGRIPLSNLAALIHVLPGELARTELQFSTISKAYDIELRNKSGDQVYARSEDLWFFEDDGSRLLELLDSVRASLRRDTQRFERGYWRLHHALFSPEAATGRLGTSSVDLHSMAWLDDHKTFKEWLNSKHSSLLAVTGPRGSGKTHLASYVLYSLRTSGSDRDAVFLSFSFYRWDLTRNTEWNLVASLIRQLLILRPSSFRLIQMLTSKLFENEFTTSAQLWELFRYIITIPGPSTVYIVVNAVDQSNTPVEEALASLISSPLPNTVPLKILVTVSGSPNLSSDSTTLHLTLEASQWSAAIRAVAADRVKRVVSKRRVWKDREEAIVDKLCYGNSSYLYVMLNLDMLEHSSIPSTKAALEQQLMVPVMSLERLFESLVERLKQSEQATLALQWVYHAVRPLTVSELSVALALSSIFSEGDATVQPTYEDLAASVSWDLMRDLGFELGPTIKVVNDTVMLVHHTFRRYLEQSSDIILPDFHAKMTEKFISYIMLCSSGEKPEKSSRLYQSQRLASSLLMYAQLYWAHHYRLSESYGTYLDDKILKFVQSSVLSSGLSVIDGPTLDFHVPEASETAEIQEKPEAPEAQKPPEGLQATEPPPSTNGAEAVKTEDASEGPGAPDTTGTENAPRSEEHPDVVISPTTAEVSGRAPEGPEAAIAPQPTESTNPDNTSNRDRDSDRDGASVSDKSSDSSGGRTSKYASSTTSIDSEDDEQLPASKRWVDVSIRAFKWPKSVRRDSLCLAIIIRADRIVQRLLQQIDGTTDKDKTRILKAAKVAASVGNVPLLEQLLDKGVPKGTLVRILCAAASSGQLNALKRLVRALEDAEELAAFKETTRGSKIPLISAAENGHSDVVEYLLEKGLHLLTTDWKENTAVHIAAWLGDVQTLKVMERLRSEQFKEALAMGNRQGLNPLQLTCEAGYVDAFAFVKDKLPNKELLEKASEKSHTPLQICAELGHVNIWEKLVEAGADPLAGDPTPIPDVLSYYQSVGLRDWEEDNATQLELASRHGYYELVSRILKLLKASAAKKESDDDAEAKKADRRKAILNSSLFEAASNGRLELVKLLFAETERDVFIDQKHLRLAIGRGHLDVIKFFVSNGVSVKKPDNAYNSHFDLAISEDHVDIVRYLIKQGLKSEWDGYETSIHYAARCGLLQCLRLLLAASESEPGDVRRKDNRNKTALELAAENCEPETFAELRKWEEEHDPPEPGQKPAWAFVYSIEASDSSERKVKFVEYLLSNGWDPNANDGDRDVPLQVAIVKGEDAVVHLLLDNGANPNTCNDENANSLHRAVSNAEHMIPWLLEKGADPNAINNAGFTPLQVAADLGRNDVVRQLLGLAQEEDGEKEEKEENARMQDEKDKQGGEDTESKQKKDPKKGQAEEDSHVRTRLKLPVANVEVAGPDGYRAIHYGVKYYDITKSLFESQKKVGRKLDVNVAAKSDGKTPLMIAAQDGPVDVVRLLLEEGADPNAKDKKGQTALFYATFRSVGTADDREDKSVVKLLVKHGAEINVVGGGTYGTPLYAALWVRYGNFDLFETLLELGARADVQVMPFGTPLHVLFLASNEIEIDTPKYAPVLVKHGAQINGLDSRGRTPLVYAVSHQRVYDAIETLLVLGADPNVTDATGSTPLHYAAPSQALIHTLELLLRSKADASALDGLGRSVLYKAALVDSHTHRSAYDAVLESVPEAERPAQKAAALAAALKTESAAIYGSIMREPGMDLNVPDRNGWLPLDIAESLPAMKEEVAELIKLGARRSKDKKEPTRLSRHDMKDDFFVSEDGTEAGIAVWEYDRFYGDSLNGTVRADYCVHPGKGIFYFEVEILELGPGAAVAIGLAQERLVLDDMIGWGTGSWGYHSDDGSLYSGDEPIDYGPPYAQGDVVGVAYDPASQKLWFVKNGIEQTVKTWVTEAKKEEGKEDKTDEKKEEDKGEKKDDEKNDDEKEGEKEGGDKDADKDDKDDNASVSGSSVVSSADGSAASTASRKPQTSVLYGQLYPGVSFQQTQKEGAIRVRVTFGPGADGKGKPFKYASPVTVPA